MSFLSDLINIGTSAIGAHQAEGQQKKIVADYTNAQNQAVSLFQPYYSGGTAAFGRATQMTTPGFQFSPTDPSYAFRLGEGVNAYDRSAAAHGSLLSGGQAKALTRYGQNLASTEYQNEFARNLALGGMGYNAAQDTASAYFNGAKGRASAYDKIGDIKQGWWGGFGGSLNSAVTDAASGNWWG